MIMMTPGEYTDLSTVDIESILADNGTMIF